MNDRKIIATILVASVLFSATGCAGKFNDSMTDSAEKVGKALITGNYKRVESCLDDKNDDLQEAMEVVIEDEINCEASEIIMSTMTYEVDEDSIESDFLGKEGTIDVTFSIVDYESILDDSIIFRDMEDFEATIEDCKDTIDTTITLEFEKQDGKPVIVNSDDLIELFSFKKEVEIILAGTLLDHIDGSGYFVGDEMVDTHPYTDEYMDTNRIEAVFDLDELGTELEWEYSYEISMSGFITLYDSDTMTKPEGSSTIDIVYEDYSVEYLQDATYVVYLYDESGDHFVEISCEVSHTEPEPEPEPEPAPISDDIVELPWYTDPSANPVLLPGDEFQITVPDGFTVLDASDPLVQGTGRTDAGRNICVYMTNSRNFEIAAVYLDDPTYLSYFQNNLEQVAQMFADGLPATATLQGITAEERTIAGQTVSCYTVQVLQGFTDTYYTMFVLSGDNSNFFMDVSASSLDELDAYLSAISHV